MKTMSAENKYKEYRKRAEEIVEKMTVEEMALQTLHAAPEIEHLGIPAYNWWNEALHGVARAGVATVFPQAIGLAATFDEDFIEIVADAISTEGRAKYNMQQRHDDRGIYKGITYWSPNVNIFRDPRWGRGHETFGEDPYLTSRLGVRFIHGLQGHDENYLKSAACAKHFAVHSGPEGIRHSFDAIVSKRDLRETYLPAFEACVKEGNVEAVMGAYNMVNGSPCCGNKELLMEILRDEWGFKGHVLSDCWAIKDFHEGHNVTRTPIESVSMAMNNGCDLNCGNLFIMLAKAVEENRVDVARLKEAVINLYITRIKLGVLDQKEKTPFDDIQYSVVDSKEMRDLNLKAAEKACCLLKNKNQLLPLDKSKIKNIGIIGPNANSRRALVGNYEGTASRYFTITEGLQEYVGDGITIKYSEGCHIHREKLSSLCERNELRSEVEAVCEASDVVIAVMGLDADLEGEEGDTGNEFASGDKPNLRLPGLQEEILKTIKKSGKPTILILLSGSALAVNYADENFDAVIQGWYPGAQGGRAIARLLFAEANFEGKLPITFYNAEEKLPEFTNYSMENRTYRYMKTRALYPFGYGLSYSKFSYSNIKVDSDDVPKSLVITATVKNDSSFDGVETVQTYIKSPMKNAPNYQLKNIVKLPLKAGGEKEITVTLSEKEFGVFDDDGVFTIEKGVYHISFGGGQPDARTAELTGKATEIIEVNVK